MRFKSTKQFVNYLFEQTQPQQTEEKSKLVFLIGPPAVGKTEYIKTNLSGYEIVNRDDIVEKVASEQGVGTYDDMFEKPPSELATKAGPPPEKEIISGYETNPEAKKTVDDYLEKIKGIASTVPPHKQYGSIKPFDLKALQDVVVKFGVPTKRINPFVWEKVDSANKLVGEKLADMRSKAIGSKSEKRKNMVIDMVNMSLNERNMHRKDILKALGEDPNNLNKINDYYNQVAIVFAPKGGYTPEIMDQIKQVAIIRQKEIKAAGGAKTIPPQVYEDMFASYKEPSTDEGFEEIKYVGVPSLAKLTKSEPLQEGFLFRRNRRHREF